MDEEKKKNYNIDEISEYIGENFKERLTLDDIDYIHLYLGGNNKEQVKERIASKIDEDFLENLYYLLNKQYCNIKQHN